MGNKLLKISFIIIGRNEGWKLTKCFQSVFQTIKQNSLSKYEVIYVDSKSTDDSIERVKVFEKTKIFQLTSDINAAIARNVGAIESKGDVLFFIDGDMEIIPDFIPLVYNESDSLKYNFVSGQFEDYYYSKKGVLIDKQLYHSMVSNERQEYTTGGLFLIKRNIWEKISGMKNHLRRNQDIDLGIRLAGINIFLIRRKELLAKHHTIKYQDKHRIWSDFIKGNDLFRSILHRENFKNFYQHKLFIRENYTLLLLLVNIGVILLNNNSMYGVIYLGLIGLRSIKNVKYSIIELLNIYAYYILRDFAVLSAFFLYWPQKEKNINYIQID
ncbi:MAG: glycosyltransferase [Bacteroidetes bacterium]|nr:glycosyltransferase [Bacteroidota bacterium]